MLARRARTVGGVLLTGGTSRRMGTDKATMVVGHRSLAERVAARLQAVADPVVEVGQGVSGVDIVVSEAPPGGGPLAATLAGAEALWSAGCHGPILLVACDLPLVTVALLQWLADVPGGSSVVPVVAGRLQPLCARWSALDIAEARQAYRRGERSMRPLTARPAVLLADERWWGSVSEPEGFADVDCPADLDRLRLEWRPGDTTPR
ncbi:MAG: molybdenum cofactor guanylyltransferase [Actinomycetota bacterium]|nr:molybdenum cofactor guanylyltransferase [Actinomycetota bacterium]